MAFDNPPEAPSEADPQHFAAEASAFIAWMQSFATEFIAYKPTIDGAQSAASSAAASAAAAAGATGYASTCTTSIALSTGAKSVTLQTGKSFPAASNFAVVFVRQADASVRLTGVLNPYNSGTGAATFTVSSFTGTGGPYTDWICVAAAFVPPLGTAAQVQAGIDPLALLTVKALYDAALPQTLTDAATIAWDMGLGWNAKVTLAGNRTIAAPSNFRKGITYTLEVIQDATGSRTLSWNTAYDFGLVGAPTLSTGAGKRDLVFLYCYDDTPGAPKLRGSYSKSA